MADMSTADKEKAAELIEQVQQDDVQRRLRQGFQTDFVNSVLSQWADREWLSERQLEILENIVKESDRPARSSNFSRMRYEGR